MTEKAEPLWQALNVYHDASSRSAAMNMAIDEAMLELTSSPCIRFYHWDHPALSFGYFGKFSDVAHEEGHRELVRRWTGGGIVLHDIDLTYSLVIPNPHSAEISSPFDVYQRIHCAMRYVLVEDGIEATLVEGSLAKISDSCFANPVRADVVIDGKKIAGAAQRRTRRGLLQQGSIRYENLSPDFGDRFARLLCRALQPRTISREIVQCAEKIAQQKYARRSWLERC
jgi:lipoate-protein ligase A